MLLDMTSDAPSKALRSGALTVAAYNLNGSLAVERRYLEEAVSLEPQSPIARFAYAEFLHEKVGSSPDEFRSQFWKAERLADEPDALRISEYITARHLDISDMSIEMVGGNKVEHVKKFHPSGVIPTPQSAGFKTILPGD
jgi:hypothetical protein